MVRRRTITSTPRYALLGGLIGAATPCMATASPAAPTEASPVALEPAAPSAAPELPAEPPAEPPAAADVSGSSSPSAGSPPAGSAPPAAEGAPSAPLAPPDTAAAVPQAPPDAAAVPQAPPEVAPPEDPEPEPEPAGIDPSLLDTAAPETTPGPAPSSRTVEYDLSDPEQLDAQRQRQYDNLFRNEQLGARLNVTAHLQFANMGSNKAEGVGGRMAGGSVDVGAAWNRISIAGTASAWGGRFFLPPETGAEMNTMFGGGPTLGYGRTALLGQGFFDLRVGYHMYYGVVNARRGGAAVVASQGEGTVIFTQTENLSPHGPRVRVDMGLMSQANRKRFHAFGLSVGYQGLVHSFRGELPVTHMLTLGLAYWMG